MDVVMDRVEGAAEALGASTTALLVAVVAGAITLCFMRNRRRRARWRKRGRAMSFASSVMVAGSFPKEANVPAPIINGLVSDGCGCCSARPHAGGAGRRRLPWSHSCTSMSKPSAAS